MNSIQMKTITVDPKIFISPPFIKCPKCEKDTFGILMICDRHYCRRCRECFYPRGHEAPVSYPLPELNKKVIYIDQFAISNMMKVLNPSTRAFQKGTLDNFWFMLFERIDSLCKLQLVICPDSLFHHNESLVTPYFEPLKRMYELLSHGITFYDHETIKRFQIYEHAQNWITGNPQKQLKLDVHSIVSGRINAWQDRLIFSVNLNYGGDWTNSLRQSREKVCEGLSEVFKHWQADKNKTFDDWFEEESRSFGKITLELCLNYIKKWEEIQTGHSQFDPLDLIPSESFVLFRFIQEAFKKAGVSDSEILLKTVEYLLSPCLKDVPFNKISSMLFAALARKAAAGQRKPPNQGMANDIEVISVLLPYCDAMFIDKECHTYLREKPLCDEINYGTRFFSLLNKEEFLGYLNDIEAQSSPEHFDKVAEVYGESWKEPYTTLYTSENGGMRVNL